MFDPSRLPAHRRTFRFLTALLLLSPAVIFTVPFLVRVHPAFSDSYLFGFNNRVALLLFFAVMGAVGALGWTGRLPVALQGADRVEDGRASPGLRALGVSLLVAAVVSAGLWVGLRPARGASESIYFLDRIGLLAQGLRPYRDFEFAYGPLQLYGPLAAARLLHLSLADGYALVWLVSSLLGLWLLWIAVRLVELPGRGKRAVFALLAAMLGSEILSNGLNYNPLRYAAPIACLLLVERVSRAARTPTPATSARTVAAAVLAAVLLIGLSPEIGVAFSVAVAVFLPARRWMRGEGAAGFALAMGVCLGAVLLLANRLRVFDTLKGFSAGGFNLPVLPGPHILLFLSAWAVVVLYLVTGTRRERLGSDVGLLTMYSVGTLPAALGRCDWAHTLGYALGVVLCALLLLATTARARVVSQGLLLGVFALLFLQGVEGTVAILVKVQLYPMLANGGPQTELGRRLMERTRRQMERTFGSAEGDHKLARIQAVARMPSEDPHAVFPEASAVVGAPFSYSPRRLGNVQSRAIAEGAFMGTLNVLTAQQVEEKVDEMREHPERDLLLSPDGMEQCAPLRGNPATLRALFLLPVVPAPRYELRLTAPICEYIVQHYRVVVPGSAETGDYGLWRRVPGE